MLIAKSGKWPIWSGVGGATMAIFDDEPKKKARPHEI
ncbi:DUF1192 domain-containing protein, partial [Mesorhizobium sp. M2D.F.Ca.ET.145.01.1.1]